MIKKFEDLDLSRQYTYADYLIWRLKERLELFKAWVNKSLLLRVESTRKL